MVVVLSRHLSLLVESGVELAQFLRVGRLQLGTLPDIVGEVGDNQLLRLVQRVVCFLLVAELNQEISESIIITAFYCH